MHNLRTPCVIDHEIKIKNSWVLEVVRRLVSIWKKIKPSSAIIKEFCVESETCRQNSYYLSSLYNNVFTIIMFEIATNQTQMWEYGSKTEDKRKSAVLSGEDTKMPQFHLMGVYSMYFLHIPHNTSRRSPPNPRARTTMIIYGSSELYFCLFQLLSQTWH